MGKLQKGICEPPDKQSGGKQKQQTHYLYQGRP